MVEFFLNPGNNLSRHHNLPWTVLYISIFSLEGTAPVFSFWFDITADRNLCLYMRCFV